MTTTTATTIKKEFIYEIPFRVLTDLKCCPELFLHAKSARIAVKKAAAYIKEIHGIYYPGAWRNWAAIATGHYQDTPDLAEKVRQMRNLTPLKSDDVDVDVDVRDKENSCPCNHDQHSQAKFFKTSSGAVINLSKIVYIEDFSDYPKRFSPLPENGAFIHFEDDPTKPILITKTKDYDEIISKIEEHYGLS